jgi:hypothetical protein
MRKLKFKLQSSKLAKSKFISDPFASNDYVIRRNTLSLNDHNFIGQVLIDKIICIIISLKEKTIFYFRAFYLDLNNNVQQIC